MTETSIVADPLEQIRAEIERIKGWPKSSAHRNGHPLGRCDACSCRWPCTEAEVALDAARMARTLEVALNAIESKTLADAALVEIAKLLTEAPADE